MRWKKRESKDIPSRRVLSSSSIRDKSFIYYKAQRHAPNTKPVEMKEPEYSRLRLLPSLVAILVIAGSIFYALTLSTSPNVRTVRGQTSIYRPLSEYESYAASVMSRDLSSYTKLSANTTQIEYEILEHYPELDAVAFRLPVLGRKPTLTISIRKPALMLSTQSSLFVLDQSGRAVALAKDVDSTKLAGLHTIKDESGLEIEVGDQAVTSGTVEFVRNLDLQLQDKQLEMSSLTLPQTANQLNISIKGVDYFIKVDITGDPRLQAGRFIAVKEELARQGTEPLDYVDVRVEDKVFYR